MWHCPTATANSVSLCLQSLLGKEWKLLMEQELGVQIDGAEHE